VDVVCEQCCDVEESGTWKLINYGVSIYRLKNVNGKVTKKGEIIKISPCQIWMIDKNGIIGFNLIGKLNPELFS
jgi:hypothetical protein